MWTSATKACTFVALDTGIMEVRVNALLPKDQAELEETSAKIDCKSKSTKALESQNKAFKRHPSTKSVWTKQGKEERDLFFSLCLFILSMDKARKSLEKII